MPREFSLSLVRAVVGVLVNAQGQILITERPAGKPYAGYWEFPGGKIEAEESSFDALKRELHEELGVEVLTAQSWLQCTHSYPDKDVWLDIWKVTQFDGQPHGKEGQTISWILPEEITQYKILEGNYQLVDQLLGVRLGESL